MHKQVFCILLTLFLALTSVACSRTLVEDNPEITTDATEGISVIPSDSPTEPTSEFPTEEPTEAPTEAVAVQHSGLRPDGSFDSGTWFFGDSMTCILISDYLMPNNLIGDANYTAKYGANITAFFGDTVMSYESYGKCMFRPEHEGYGYDEVATLLDENATAIYMMFGTNYWWTMSPDSYIEIVDYLLLTCPNATIHMQLIPWGPKDVVCYELVNGLIQEAYDHYQQIGEDRVFLIDTYTAIGRNHDSGGIHLAYTGNENWYNAIVEHAKANNLSQ